MHCNSRTYWASSSRFRAGFSPLPLANGVYNLTGNTFTVATADATTVPSSVWAYGRSRTNEGLLHPLQQILKILKIPMTAAVPVPGPDAAALAAHTGAAAVLGMPKEEAGGC